jgi:hypothetical protein
MPTAESKCGRTDHVAEAEFLLLLFLLRRLPRPVIPASGSFTSSSLISIFCCIYSLSFVLRVYILEAGFCHCSVTSPSQPKESWLKAEPHRALQYLFWYRHINTTQSTIVSNNIQHVRQP